MENFEFHIDRKVTIWVRDYYSIQSESLDQAKEKMIANFNEGKDLGFCESEYLYRTQKDISPSQNNGESTVELFFSENDQLLKTN